MTITLTHKFVSAIPDGADATVVRPSNWNDTHDVSGTLPIANGGTNTASVPANGQLLIGNGTDYTVANLTAGTGVTITNTAGGITLSAPDNGTVTGVTASSPLASSGGTAPNISLTGTVPVANGGTGAATLTGYVIGNGTSAMTASATIPTSNLTGTLPVANGGTGQTTYTDGQLLIGNSTGNTLAKATLTAGTGVTITNGPGTITISAPDTGTVTAVTASSPLASSGGATPNLSLTGTVAIANGGTAGTATPTAGAVPYGTGTAYAFSAAGTTGQVLTSAGAGAPTWTTPTTGTVTSVTASSPLASSGGATPNLTLGTVPVANGGTNATATPTAGAIAYGTGTAYAFSAAGTSGQILLSGAAGAPTWATLSSSAVTSFSAGTTGLTPSSGTTGAVTLAGTLGIANGGTNSTATATAGGIGYGTGTAHAYTAAGTTGQVLTSNGASAPTWAAAATGTVTSVAQSFTGGLISVAGSPITSSGTLALTVAGTSGGVPYFSSGTSWASTAAGTTGQFLKSNGAGAPTWADAYGPVYTKTTFTATAGQTTFTVAYTVGYIDVYLNGVKLTTSEYTASNGTSVVLGTAAALNDIVETIAWSTFSATNTNIGVGTGTSLALGGATIGTNALAVTGTAAISGATTLGVASTTQGSLILANTSANSTTLKSSNSATAAWTLTLPITAGTSGQFLQTNGSGTASWAALNNYITGLTLSTAGSSATFGVAVGVAADSTNAAMMMLTSAYTKTTSAWAVGTGNGALDTGAIANSTWYYVWLIQRSDTGVVDPLISLSATAPTMPTNYDRKRRIGAMKTNGSAQWTKFVQVGDVFLWDAPVMDFNTTPAVGPGNVTLTVPTGVTVKALLGGRYRYSIQTYAIYIYSPLVADQTSYAAAQSIGTGNDPFVYNIQVLTNTSAQIRYSASDAVGTLQIVTVGWEDQRGSNG